MSKPPHYRRPALAKTIADELFGLDRLSDAVDGMFIAGPRRTGKSEFLIQDLKPELEARGALVLYVDLWVNKAASPLQVLAQAIAQASDDGLGVVGKTAKQSGLKTVGVPGVFSFDASQVGGPQGWSLYDALLSLYKRQGKPLCVIVDEAQHALTSEDGDAAMAALKSARDQFKQLQPEPLMVVMSGSHKDKLMRLLDTVQAPFWGSQVRDLPLLDREFVAWFLRDLQAQRPELGQVLLSQMETAFRHVGSRPISLKTVVRKALQDFESFGGASFGEMLVRAASQEKQNERQRHTEAYLGLEPLPQAVMRRLLELGPGFKAFDAAALRFYAETTAKKVAVAQVQRALESLRTIDPPMVWKSLRGDYAPYDQELTDWHSHLVGERNWPPKPLGRPSTA